MSSEIFYLNTLNKLQYRVVRGARVSFKNALFSGNVIIGGTETTNPLYEYLIEISVSGDVPPKKQVSDPIAQYIFIRNSYTNSGYPDYTRTYIPPPGFLYNKTNSVWGHLPGSVPSSSIPMITGSQALQDDVTLDFISSVQLNKFDFTYIGNVVKKILVNSSSGDITDLSLTPIPYPPDHSTFQVYYNDVLKSLGVDYTINYSQSPVFLFPFPPYSQRTVAFLKFLGTVSPPMQFVVTDDFSGNFIVLYKGAPLQNILPGSEVITVGTDVKRNSFDYSINYQTGSVDFTKNIDQETLVKYVFYQDNIFDDGVVLVKGSGDPANPIYLNTNRLVNGVDYNLNEDTGTIVFSNPLLPTDSVSVSYFVKGDELSGAQAEKKTLVSGQITVQTEKFPILVNSITITDAPGLIGQNVLIENEDYTVSYKTGNITFLKILKNPNIAIEYTPLANISCILRPTVADPDLFNITIKDDPLQVVDGSQYAFNVLNPNVSVKQTNNLNPSDFSFLGSIGTAGLESVSLKNPITGDEKFYDITGYTYTDSSKALKLRSNLQSNKPILGQSSLVVASYTYSDTKLPYAPIVSNTLSIPEGVNYFKVEGEDKTGVLIPGGLIRIVDKVTDSFFYFILNTVSFNSVDTFCTILGTFPQDIQDPTIFVSDSTVSMVTTATTFSAAGAKSNTVIFAEDPSEVLRVGSILKINNEFVHSIVSVSDTGTSILVDIVPALFKSLETTDIVLVSDYPIYTEGDTIITTKEYVLTDPPQAVFEIKYLNGNNGSATASLASGILTIQETVNSQTTEPIPPVSLSSYPTVKSLADYLSANLGVNYQVTLFSDNPSVSWKSSNLIPFSATQLPYSLTINTEIILNGNDLPFQETSLPNPPTSFIVDNGDIVLSRRIVRNDRVLATYQGRSPLAQDIGKTVTVSAKFFTSLANGTKVSVSTEYLNPDQFFIETIQEGEYVQNVFFQEIQQQVTQNSGQVGGGVEGSNDAPVDLNSSGGATNNYYTLREQEIRVELFKKIEDYYENRLKTFGKELLDIVGIKVGNNDSTLLETDARNTFISEQDVQNALTNSSSLLYPEGYTLTSPQFSARFSQEIPSYIQAHFANTGAGGKGQATVTAYSGWLDILSPNDQIRISGRTDYFTISSIDPAGLILNFNAAISNFTPGDYDFFVKFETKPLCPIWDDSLYLGAKAISQEYIVGTAVLSFGTFRKFSINTHTNNLQVLVTLSNGTVVTVNSTSVPSPGATLKTTEEVVSWLSGDTAFSNYFVITNERAYGKLGARDSVVFRGYIRDNSPLVKVVSFQFSGVPSGDIATNLGFAIGVDYTSYKKVRSVDFFIEQESAQEQSQTGLLQYIEYTIPFNKLNRTKPLVKAPLPVNQSVLIAGITAANAPIGDALTQDVAIQIEIGDPTGGPFNIPQLIAINNSNIQAGTAITKYTAFQTTISNQTTINNSYGTTLTHSYGSFILGFEQKILSRLDAQNSIAANLVSLNQPLLTFAVQGVSTIDDGRIFFGDKTISASIVVDSTLYKVFPKYSSTDLLNGSWDTSLGSTTVMTLSMGIISLDSFTYTIDEVSITLNITGVSPYTKTIFFSSLPVPPTPPGPLPPTPVIFDLVSAINANTSGNFVAAVVGSNITTPVGWLRLVSSQPVTTLTPVVSEQLQYSQADSFNFIMSTALNISSTGTNPKYQITDTLLILFSDEITSYTIAFNSFPTLISLVNQINTVSGFSAALASVSSGYVYGHLAIRPLTVITGTMSLFLGARGDITYYQISDKQINSKISSNNSRISEIDTFHTYLNSTRLTQVQSSLGGEGLSSGWGTWLNFRMNKETGCNFQEMYITNQIAKNNAQRAQVQNLL